MKQAFPADHAVPISKAIRAGDFVFTSAYGPWVFDPREVTFDEAGEIIDDGTGNKSMPFDEQVHRTFDFVKAALAVAGCTLDDVVNCECWLTDPRDFVADVAAGRRQRAQFIDLGLEFGDGFFKIEIAAHLIRHQDNIGNNVL